MSVAERGSVWWFGEKLTLSATGRLGEPAPLTARVDGGPFSGTPGVGPDLYAGAQQAVRAMIDHITGTNGLSPEDAYLLASLCVDLKISEIVDAGQWVVSALLPEAVFLPS